ncbi:MAG: ribonuclease III [Endomicrobium sp.]|jgi:ribonuclease-3|nr:ribonuclease III [Endomicrobium sp.]
MFDEKHLQFQKVIEYKFNDTMILKIALTHKSYTNETDVMMSNERMEFLGDSILSAIVAEEMYVRYPYENEGKLSQFKAQIVSAPNLSAWAEKISLGNYIFLGKSENTKIAKRRENLLCDVFEAVVGAVYLDGGFENAKKIVLNFLNDLREIIIKDYKSKLQEVVQSVCKCLPEYKVIKEFGPDHIKKFEIGVYINGKFFGSGIGNSKKEAQQLAAQQAMTNVDNLPI